VVRQRPSHLQALGIGRRGSQLKSLARYIGTFQCAEQGALAFARSIGIDGCEMMCDHIARLQAERAMPPPALMTVAEAHAAAAAEGLTLIPSDLVAVKKGAGDIGATQHPDLDPLLRPMGATGWKGVTERGPELTGRDCTTYVAYIYSHSLEAGARRRIHIGTYTSAAEAALNFARAAKRLRKPVASSSFEKPSGASFGTTSSSSAASSALPNSPSRDEDAAAAEAGRVVLTAERPQQTDRTTAFPRRKDSRNQEEERLQRGEQLVAAAARVLELAACAGEGVFSEDTEPLCPICLDPLSDSAVGRTPCGHAFHTVCLLRWREVGHVGSAVACRCPECRAPLSSSSRRMLGVDPRRG